MKSLRRWTIIAALTVLIMVGGILSGSFVQPARAVGLGTILRIGGVVLVVNTFGGQMNSFINNVLGQHQVQATGASKVVPIFSVGRGSFIGAAQVVGLPDNVQRVRAIGAVGATLGNLQGDLLVPIATQKPGRGNSLNRVEGVGISAIIDIHI